MNLQWNVGQVRITRVEETIIPLRTKSLIPDCTPEIVAADADWLEPVFFDPETGRMRLSIHTFVVESEDQIIVIDTCIGPNDHPLRGDAEFPSRLDTAIPGGLDAVDIVLCTHLHFDHVGWNTLTVNGAIVPTFPNARYLFNHVEMDHFLEDDSMQIGPASIQPLIEAGLVDYVATDHRITGEVRLIPSHGHTPGHVSVVIESDGARAITTGDAPHSPVQFAHPDIASTADWDAEMATATRRRVVHENVDTDTLILGTHFPPPTAGFIRRRESGVWFDVSGQVSNQ